MVTTVSSGNKEPAHLPATPARKSWGLREFTMFASFICAIDCTLFPVLLTVLPAAEMITPESSAMIHHVGCLRRPGSGVLVCVPCMLSLSRY